MSVKYKCRFFLQNKREYVFAKEYNLVNYGIDEPRKIFIVDGKPLSFWQDPDYVFEPYTGYDAVNGQIFVGDLVEYNGFNCKVSYSFPSGESDHTDLYEYFLLHGDTKISLSSLEGPIEITGDCHFGAFSEEENDEEIDDINNDIPEDNALEEDSEDYEDYEDSESEDDPLERIKEVDFSSNDVKDTPDFEENSSYNVSDDDTVFEEDSEYDEAMFQDDDEEYTGEEFTWDDSIDDVLDVAFTKKLKTNVEVFLKSLLNRTLGCGSYAAYVYQNGTENIFVDFVKSANKKLLEMRALLEVLESLSEPCLIRLHTDVGFLPNLISGKINISNEENSDLLEDYLRLKPLIDENKFTLFVESPENPPVELLMAEDEAKSILVTHN